MPFDATPAPQPQTQEALVPFTLPHFAAWLRRHDPAKRYDYCSSGNCLIAQYVKHLHPHVEFIAVGRNRVTVDLETIVFPYEIKEAAHGTRSKDMDRADRWTFGAAADRCDEYLRAEQGMRGD